MALGGYPTKNGQPGREPWQRNVTNAPPRITQETQNGIPPVPSRASLEAMRNCRVLPELTNYIRDTAFPYIRDVTDYVVMGKVGEGTFGEVFKAICRRNNQVVALKKILIENESQGFPITALREVKMLQQLKHENITELIEVCSNKSATDPRERSTFFLVFAFCDHDLAGLLNNRKIKFSITHIKTLLKHLFNGLDKLHREKVMHRDMKTANILVSKEGILKLADFGLSRCHLEKGDSKKNCYTNQVVTLWYRPPALLLGERNYTYAVDLWGAGCIMTEMWTRHPIFQADTEQKQLKLIISLCGSISTEVWPEVATLPLWNRMELPFGIQPRQSSLVTHVKDPSGVDLIERLLKLNPKERFTAKNAMDHHFFYAHPHPQENIKDLMDTLTTSMFEIGISRGPGQQRPVVSQQERSNAVHAGHCHDMVF